MAIFSNAFSTYDAVGIREDLSDLISDISPQKTPLTSMVRRRSVDNTHFEWQTDSLADASTSNAQLEGDNITSYSAITATTRLGNYCQISRKDYVISGTEEAVNKAGRASERAYQKMKKGAELKRDVEAIMLSNQGAVSGGTGTARQTATLGAFVKTNTDAGTGGGDPAYSSGIPVNARTDATSTNQRAFTETILKSVISSAWTEGAEPDTLMVGPFNKQTVSGFSGIATRNFDISNTAAKPTAVIAAVDVYVSDFGTFRVVPNRFQRERDAWLIDRKYIRQAVLRPYFTREMPESVDGSAHLMILEWGLQVDNEAALGLCADLTTS